VISVLVQVQMLRVLVSLVESSWSVGTVDLQRVLKVLVVLSGASVILWVVSLFAVLWMALANLKALNVQGAKYSPWSGVGRLLVPGANLFWFPAVMQELWQGSAPDGNVTAGSSWQGERKTRLPGIVCAVAVLVCACISRSFSEITPTITPRSSTTGAPLILWS